MFIYRSGLMLVCGKWSVQLLRLILATYHAVKSKATVLHHVIIYFILHFCIISNLYIIFSIIENCIPMKD